jgi:hypothetical protein
MVGASANSIKHNAGGKTQDAHSRDNLGGRMSPELQCSLMVPGRVDIYRYIAQQHRGAKLRPRS